jgi:UDP-glucose 4-epimerase
MKILVTGGAGFIGSHITEALVKRGHDVRVLDNFFSGKPENLTAVRRDIELIRGDCADLATVRKAVRGIEAIFHEAAVPSVPRSVKDPMLSHRNNSDATIAVLTAARDAGVRRVIYAGSSSVYGDQRGRRKREDMAPRPLSPYAVGKLTGELYLRVFARLYGMETLTLRYFNVFGPRQDPSSPYSGVMSRFATALLTNGTPVIYGDGLQSRDFTYVGNVLEGNLLALKAKGLCGQAVNVATGHRVKLKQLLAALAKEIGVPARAEHQPPRPGDIRHSLADISAAKRLLGYVPRYTFAEGLKATVGWYRQSTGKR